MTENVVEGIYMSPESSPRVTESSQGTYIHYCETMQVGNIYAECTSASGTQIPLNSHSKRNNACSNFVPCHIFLSRDIR